MFRNHPKGMSVIFFAEVWERFSYYGMRALLTLYMTKQMLYSDTKAFGVFAAYTTLVYATPVIGGYIADKVLGQRKSVLFGAFLMMIGHFLMAFPGETIFYLALAVLVTGNGFFKPNLSTLLGKLYHKGDERRDAGFNLFYMAVNIGSMVAPIACGFVGEFIGWHYGFSLAGFGMFFGWWYFRTRQNVFGDKGLPPDPKFDRDPLFLGLTAVRLIQIGGILSAILFALLIAFNDFISWVLPVVGIGAISYAIYSGSKVDGIQRRKLFVAMTLIFFAIVFWSFFEQVGSSLTLYADRNVDRTLGDELVIDQESIEKLTSAGIDLGGIIPLLEKTHVSRSSFKSALQAATTDGHAEEIYQAAIPYFKEGWLTIPASASSAINGAFIVILVPFFTFMWNWLRKRNLEPSTPMKFVLALIQIGLGFGFFAIGVRFADNAALVPLIFLIGGYFLHTTGELCLSPVGLSMITRLSPASIVTFMMGTWLLSNSFANHIAGIIAKLTAVPASAVGTVSSAESLALYAEVFTNVFWAALAAAGILLLLTPLLKKWMFEEK